MAVTTTFSVQTIKGEFNISRTPANETNPSLLALADGGFAVLHEVESISTPADGLISLERYTSNGDLRSGITQVDTFTAATPTNDPALTQLTNGNILTVWQEGSAAVSPTPGIHFAIVNPANGAIIAADTLLTNTNGSDRLPQVAALQNGGFVVVTQDTINPTDQDADLRFYSDTGAFVTSRALGGDSILDEQAPAVAVLNNFNVVVAYEKELINGTDTFGMAIEIYTQAGVLVLGQTIFDNTGVQNRNPSILALKSGGFAVAYQDDQAAPGVAGLSIAVFTANGTLSGIRRLDNDVIVEGEIDLTELPNGMISATWASQINPGVDHDILNALFDPVALQMLDVRSLESQNGLQTQPSVITLGNGDVVTSWTDFNSSLSDGNTDATGTHVSLQINRWVRISIGDSANDIITGDNLADSINGGGGSDFITGGGGPDNMDGGAGFNAVSWFGESAQVVINLTNQALNASAAAGDIVSNFQAYYLTSFGDNFTNNNSGGYIYGFDGNDVIMGGTGSDFIEGGTGGDFMNGGAGFDYVSYANATAAVTVSLVAGGARSGEAFGDSILNIEAFYLSAHADTFIGQDGQNIVFGGGGADRLTGGANANDWLFGEAGNDTLSGGVFDDLLSGGGNADTYAFDSWVGNGFDSVLDFVSGTDKIQFTGSGFGLLPGATFVNGVTFVAAASPFATTAQGTVLYATTLGILYYDPDGSGAGAAIALAQFAGAPVLAASDFVVV